MTTTAQHPNITFVLFSHDQRGPMNDSILARRLVDSLRGEVSENQLILPPEPLQSEEIKALCAPLDGAFTCRMHFGVACLSQGVPIVAIGYQGKFEGLMERFGLVNMLLPDANALTPEKIAPLLEYLIRERAQLKAAVLEKLPGILHLAACNFSSCLPTQAMAELSNRGLDWGNFQGRTKKTATEMS